MVSSFTILIASAAAIATLATFTNAAPSSPLDNTLLAPRADSSDPCATWCDPWFAITDAKDACQALVNDNGKNLQLCSGCSIAHGGSIDLWAADYYGVNTDAAYSYKTDCQSCFNIDVPGINFGAVKQIYNDFLNPTSSSSTPSTPSTSTLSNNSTNRSSTKSIPSTPTSSNTKSSITPLAQLEQLNSNSTSTSTTTSGALKSTSATVSLAILAVFIGASI